MTSTAAVPCPAHQPYILVHPHHHKPFKSFNYYYANTSYDTVKLLLTCHYPHHLIPLLYRHSTLHLTYTNHQPPYI